MTLTSPSAMATVERRYRRHVLRTSLSAIARSTGKDGPIWQKFVRESWGLVPRSDPSIHQRPVWIASGSGGELIQCYSLCRELKAVLTNTPLALSTTNAQSLKFARGIPGPDRIFFTPWDLTGACRRAIKRLRPAVVIQIETPFHPVLAREAQRSGCLTLLVSAFMSAHYECHQNYERLLVHDIFDHLDWLCTKSESDREGFIALGVPKEKIIVLGDLRYDHEYFAVSDFDRKRWRSLLGFGPNEAILVAGSVRAGEETMVISGYLEARHSLPDLRLLLAPRFLSDIPRMVSALRELGVAVTLRSEKPKTNPSGAVVILDSFGELPHLYSVASFIFLGGTLVPIDSATAFGQNLVEPLAQGAPIFFGPYMSRWEEIVAAFTTVYPGLRVTGAGELGQGIVELHGRPDLVSKLKELAETIVQERGGGLNQHIAFIQKIVAKR